MDHARQSGENDRRRIGRLRIALMTTQHFSRWQVVLYFVEILGLVVWIGGLMMIIAVVIPAVFNSLGMEAGGRFLRRVFDGYGYVTMGILMSLVIVAAIRFGAGRFSVDLLFPVTRFEVVLLTAMVLLTVGITWVFGPQAIALQEQAFQATTEIAKKTAYDQFFHIHMIVRGLYLANLGFAFGLFIAKLRQGLGVHPTIE